MWGFCSVRFILNVFIINLVFTFKNNCELHAHVYAFRQYDQLCIATSISQYNLSLPSFEENIRRTLRYSYRYNWITIDSRKIPIQSYLYMFHNTPKWPSLWLLWNNESKQFSQSFTNNIELSGSYIIIFDPPQKMKYIQH